MLIFEHKLHAFHILLLFSRFLIANDYEATTLWQPREENFLIRK